MNHAKFLAALGMTLAVSVAPADERLALANPAIDMQAHLRVSAEAARHREPRRLSEADFIKDSRLEFVSSR